MNLKGFLTLTTTGSPEKRLSTKIEKKKVSASLHTK